VAGIVTPTSALDCMKCNHRRKEVHIARHPTCSLDTALPLPLELKTGLDGEGAITPAM
jgi:hypothetical protein